MINDSKLPADGYGFDFTFKFLRTNLDSHTIDYKFFTKGDNSYLKEVTERGESVTVYLDGRRNVTRAEKSVYPNESPCYQLSTNLTELCRVLNYYALPSVDNSPYKHAYQLLVNPCYSFLGESISPEQLLDLPENCIVKQPSENGCEVYLIKDFIEHPSKPEFLLYFSQANNDKLVKCILRDCEGVSKTIYADKWKNVSGMFVASEIHRKNDRLGSEEIIAVTSPRIGGLKDSAFDTTKMSEFNQKWDAVLDYGKLGLGDPNWITRPNEWNKK
ncbi:MAG: hypothetical protein ACRC2T_17625 [Thermoguttaceae bacterium]